MKKMFLMAVFLTASFTAQSQTTTEEYNYLTKGLKIEIDSGLDPKAGYSFNKIGENSISSYNFKFFNFVKTDNNASKGVLIMAYSKISEKLYYLAIPNNNTELLQKYYDSVSLLDEAMTTALCIATSDVLTKVQK